MGYWFIIVILWLSIFYTKFAGSLTYCQAGTYEFQPPLGGREVCELCLPGTVMPHHDHRYKTCFDCTSVEDPNLEIEVSSCNRTHDTVIECIDGYYRRLPRNPNEKARCEKCSECHFPYHEVRSCQKYDDTGCCPGENYDTFINEDGVPLCRERPWLCRQGQYFSRNSFACLPCPEDTFMPADYHTMPECLKCQDLSEEHLPLHGKRISPCNRTHQTVLGCEEGYYLNHSMGISNNDIGCSPCTQCNTTDRKFMGRKCDHFHDTVCCSHPDMEVADTEAGPECVNPTTDQTTPTPDMRPTVCGLGQFLSFAPDSTMATCKTCPEGTCMLETDHTNTACRKCEDFQGKEKPQEWALDLCRNTAEQTRQKRTVPPAILISLVCLFAVLFLLSSSFNIILLRRTRRLHKHPATIYRTNIGIAKAQNSQFAKNINTKGHGRHKQDIDFQIRLLSQATEDEKHVDGDKHVSLTL